MLKRRILDNFIKWSFYMDEGKILELRKLSSITGIPQAVYMREALDWVLKKYNTLMKVEGLSVEHLRALTQVLKMSDEEDTNNKRYTREFLNNTQFRKSRKKKKVVNHSLMKEEINNKGDKEDGKE